MNCHKEQAQKFAGSHHNLAMQLANATNVLGDFEDATLEHHGVASRMFRDGEKYMVHTEGPDGTMQDFEVKYVFGVSPLQQYMVEFPSQGQSLAAGELPRVQVLRLCWDTIEEEWFYLAPPDVDEKLAPNDDLHWTGVAQRWNNMCAECHSTNYRKQFQLSEAVLSNAHLNIDGQPAYTALPSQGEYHSTFKEIDVSCEACHGPGSVHVALASQTFPGWNRERGYGLANLKLSSENQIQACAPCHSRRSVVDGDFKAGDNFYDHYLNQLLTEGVYYPDGQILDEDYVHGSFIQSKMYHKGIKCSDCHDVHSAQLIHTGNQVCTSCHQHPAAKYDSVAHHFHKAGSEGAQCVNCHMPATTYMAVDSRRDHSFRIPRPDLSTSLGTPNACTGCHLEPNNVSAEKRARLTLYQDWMQAARDGDEEVQRELERANDWCDGYCDKWYGDKRRRDQHFGIAISAAQQRFAGAEDLLLEVLSKRGYEAPVIARATALYELQQLQPDVAAYEAARAASDDHPLMRATAMAALGGSTNPERSVSILEQALKDPIRSVRTEAARHLLEFPDALRSSSSGPAFRKALKELTDGLEFNNDRAGAHLALGILAEQQGRNQQAIERYEAAIAVEPGVTGARSNLAALLERVGNGALSDRVAELRQQEIPLLQRDVDLLPDMAALHHRLGFALYIDGQKEKAAEHLEEAARLEPKESQFAVAAAMIYETLEQWEKAETYAESAVELSNKDPGNVELLRRIRQARISQAK